MKTSEKGIALIKRHEGLRLKAYRCPGGVWTIGYGHTSRVKEVDVITESQADSFLRQDIQTAESAVNRECSGLNQNQYDALVSFVFNVGSGNFQKSTLLRLVKANPCNPDIRKEFGRWNRSAGTILEGLVRRRKDEAALYFS